MLPHFGGEIRLVTEPGGGLVAPWTEPVGAVFQAAHVTVGSGGRYTQLLGPERSRYAFGRLMPARRLSVVVG